MTRGQDSLLGEAGEELQGHAILPDDMPPVSVHVLMASEEELAQHARQLADIDKVSKGACLWKHL